jgi:hypothetical protein
MKEVLDFIFTPLIDSIFQPLIDLLHVYLRIVVVAETIKLRMFIILHRLPTKLRELGKGCTVIDPRTYMAKWNGMEDIGRWVLLGCEMWIGLLVLWDIMAYYSRSAVHPTPPGYSMTGFEEHGTTTYDPEVSILDQRLSQKPSPNSNSGTSSKFSSTSTNRTSTTTTTTNSPNTTPADNITDNQDRTTSSNQTQARLPPQLVLRQYIYPKYSSTWPAYYLQAFNKAQESLTKEDNIHVDAPTSSGTRNNKDGCVGKIVLDRRVVKRDVKDGVVGYCEGVSGTVSLMVL